jgi:hypothetical protein
MSALEIVEELSEFNTTTDFREPIEAAITKEKIKM